MADENKSVDANGSLSTFKNGVVAINTLATLIGNLYLFWKGESIFRGALTTSVATLFTVNANRQYTINDIEIVNTSGSSQTYSLFLVPSGGTSSASNALFSATSIAANTTFQWKGAQVITAGMTIQASASAVTVTAMITGGRGNA
jgi:hypothetical protein